MSTTRLGKCSQTQMSPLMVFAGYWHPSAALKESTEQVRQACGAFTLSSTNIKRSYSLYMNIYGTLEKWTSTLH